MLSSNVVEQLARDDNDNDDDHSLLYHNIKQTLLLSKMYAEINSWNVDYCATAFFRVFGFVLGVAGATGSPRGGGGANIGVSSHSEEFGLGKSNAIIGLGATGVVGGDGIRSLSAGAAFRAERRRGVAVEVPDALALLFLTLVGVLAGVAGSGASHVSCGGSGLGVIITGAGSSASCSSCSNSTDLAFSDSTIQL